MILDELQRREISPSLQIEGPIRIGRANVSVLVINHDQSTWEENKDDVRTVILKYQTIIPEYRPSEYEDLNNTFAIGGILQLYADQNYLFNGVEQICNEANKNVWALDPAHNLDFIKLHLLLGLPEELVETAALSTIGYQLIKPSRRKFLKAAGILAVSGGTTGVLNGLFYTDGGRIASVLEADFRNVVLAKNLWDICQTDDFVKYPNTLLIIPPQHWNPQTKLIDAVPVRKYLMDKQLRESKFDYYKGLFYGAFPSLFYKRHYPPKT